MYEINTTKQNRRGFKFIVLALLALSGIFAAGNACAQAVVTDPAHTQLTMTGWIKELVAQGKQYSQQIQQYQKQVQQYQQQIKQYEQQYVKGGAFKGKPGYREKFNERDINAGVIDRCRDAPRKNPVGLEQYNLCRAIVQTQNRRFNAMVKVLEDVERRDEELQEAYKERADIDQTDAGQLQSNSNRILAIQGQMQNDVQNAKTIMETYDTLLVSLKDDQVRAANSALKNKSSLFGTAVQGVALRTALRAARSRER